jgi:hypothetical protein
MMSVEDVCILGFDYGNSTNALYEQRCRNAAIRGLQLQLKDAYHKVERNVRGRQMTPETIRANHIRSKALSP